MSKLRFTPGQWHKKGKKVYWTKPDKDLPQDNLLNGCVCICATTEDDPPEVIEEAKANAALIAAAPEMLWMLESLRQAFEANALPIKDHATLYMEILNLLAKARGGYK